MKSPTRSRISETSTPSIKKGQVIIPKLPISDAFLDDFVKNFEEPILEPKYLPEDPKVSQKIVDQTIQKVLDAVKDDNQKLLDCQDKYKSIKFLSGVKLESLSKSPRPRVVIKPSKNENNDKNNKSNISSMISKDNSIFSSSANVSVSKAVQKSVISA